MRKAILLAMAAAIVSMFAIPGLASANWTKHHVALSLGTNAELEITGTDVRLVTGSGGITCIKTISKVDFEGGTTTGKVTTFEPELHAETPTITSDCQGTGALAQCDVHEVSARNLPWTIHTATADTVTITTGTISFTTTGFFCPHTTGLTPGTMTMTVAAGQTLTTSTAELSGTLVTEGDLGESNATTAARCTYSARSHTGSRRDESEAVSLAR